MIKPIFNSLKALAFQWKSPEYIRTYQEKRLRHIIDYAYTNSPFYHNHFRTNNITPSDIKTLDDLPKIPLVTKTDLRENFSQVIPRTYSEVNCTVESTSGSTGEHITILHDLNALQYYGAVLIRGHIAVGLKPYHKTAYIRYKPLFSGYWERLGIFRFKHIYSDSPIPKIIEKLKEINPFTINCYPTIMYLVATHISQKDVEYISPHHIVTWSEKLTSRTREKVEKIFHCPVYDQYGAYEFHSMAFECTEKTMHMNADSVIIEFIKDGEPVSPGEEGEIIATSLWNKAMPFIRYRIGDVGTPSDEKCACGRTLPVMGALEGRTVDFLVKASGDFVLPSTVITLFYPYSQIDTFQIVQKKKGEILIKILKGKNYSDKIEKEILDKFYAIFNKGSTIQIEYVDKIEKVGGKQRAIICEAG
jgi:phenylacetate-CoA ligase